MHNSLPLLQATGFPPLGRARLATVVLIGVLQIVFWLLNTGTFIGMVPFPVMVRFVNDLAIVNFLAQVGHFKTADGA